jgi:hypothetical protein
LDFATSTKSAPPCDHRPGLRLVLQQDVTGMHLLAGRALGDHPLVGGAQPLVGEHLVDAANQVGLVQHPLLVEAEPPLDLRVVHEPGLARRLGDELGFHQAIQQLGVDHLQGNLAILLRQALVQHRHIGAVYGGAVDDRHHRVVGVRALNRLCPYPASVREGNGEGRRK